RPGKARPHPMRGAAARASGARSGGGAVGAGRARARARRAGARGVGARGVGGRQRAGGATAGVGAVEARTLEYDTHRVEDLAKTALALGALGERVVAEALHLLERVSTLGAGVLVGGHALDLRGTCVADSGTAGTLTSRLPMVLPLWRTPAH